MSRCKQGNSMLADSPPNSPCSHEQRNKRASNTRVKSAKKPKLAPHQSMLENAKIVVGIDFGTTFSGFAYASKADPKKIFTFYDWPGQAEAGANSYCKTQTSLWYLAGEHVDGLDLKDWGWPAHINHNQALQAKETYVKGEEKGRLDCGHFLTKFKLHLAAVGSSSGPQLEGGKLPEGLSAEQMIADYLKRLSILIMVELKKFNSSIEKKDVKWCLTLPTMWTDAAKETMKNSQMAGLITGRRCQDKDASLHPIEIVLEAEAASVYCLQKLKKKYELRKGSKFLVADLGGGTADLAVQEKLDDSGMKVKEVTCSTGALCGGTFVDTAFMKFLARKISCFEKFVAENPATLLRIYPDWEKFKCGFDGQQDNVLKIFPRLAVKWEMVERGDGSYTVDKNYDRLVITSEDMKSIFDGEVRKIVKLIRDQLVQVPEIEVIMVVGGFSNSPYVMKVVREDFSRQVKLIWTPLTQGVLYVKEQLHMEL